MNQADARILLAVPALDFVLTECAVGLTMLAYHCKSKLVEVPPEDNPGGAKLAQFFFSKNAYLCHSRTMMAEYALKIGASHIAMFDTDVWVQPTVLDKMLSRGKPIVAADYAKKRPPRELAGTPLVDPIDWSQTLWPYKYIPLGCALIETEVFRKMQRPWFAEATSSVYGEDQTFSEFAREAGYDLLVDLEVTQEIAHGGVEFWTWDAKANKAALVRS